MILLAFPLLLAAAQPTAPVVIEAKAVAAEIQPRLPRRFSPEIAMVAAAAEGDLLILTFEVSEAALAGATPEAISQRFSYGFCTPPAGRALLDGPMALRIDARTAAGQSMRGAVLETCPLAAAEGELPPPR